MTRSDQIDYMRETTLTYAKAHLSELLNRVEKGEQIFIKRNGKTVAKLIAYGNERPQRPLGQWKGKVRIKPDFDVLPDDLADTFKGLA